MTKGFFDKIQERAYFKYLNRQNFNLPENAVEDWEQAGREEVIEKRIEEEAYLHFLNGCSDPIHNWDESKREIMERISFIAFYNHETHMNQTPLDNWVESQKIYIENF